MPDDHSVNELAEVISFSRLPRNHPERDLFAVKVEFRGDDRYAVTHRASCLSVDGEWDYEPLPSSRDDEWLDGHRFNLADARGLAHRHAWDARCNGIHVVDVDPSARYRP